jgi:hypothetical protein
VHHEGTEHDVERLIRERNPLNHAEAEVDRETLVRCLMAGTCDHPAGGINAADAPCGAYLSLDDQRECPGTAAYIKDGLSRLQLGQVSGCLAQHLPLSMGCKIADPQHQVIAPPR